jgi:hypothetical protein
LNQLWIDRTYRRMRLPAAEFARLATFVESLSSGGAQDLKLRVRPLKGGLESLSVSAVSARYHDEFGKRRHLRFVVKTVHGPARREAPIYEAITTSALRHSVPSLLGVARVSEELTHLYLEAVTHDVPWPWTNLGFVGRVLKVLSRVHAADFGPSLDAHVADWDYAAELERAGASTLALAERTDFVRRHRTLPALARVVANIRPMRRELLGFRQLPPAVLHGDVHTGNVVVRWHAGANEPLLIDWARARRGSPLEDVSCFLQSLGCWEPGVQRHHDQLLSVYLCARGLPYQPSRDLECSYWFAGALNTLAGALQHHLEVASGSEFGPRARAASLLAAQSCLRVIRKADRCWRS